MEKQKRLWIDLKKLRIQRQWLQQESADKLGISRSYLSAVENGKRPISMNMMEAIINAFNVKYDDFIKYDVSYEREHMI